MGHHQVVGSGSAGWSVCQLLGVGSFGHLFVLSSVVGHLIVKLFGGQSFSFRLLICPRLFVWSGCWVTQSVRLFRHWSFSLWGHRQ